MGMSLDDVIARSTWNPAREIKQEGLGHLSVGAVADVAVLRLERGRFGFVDMYGARHGRAPSGSTCELTLRDGKVVYDLNGISGRIGGRCRPTTARLAMRDGTGCNPAPVRR